MDPITTSERLFQAVVEQTADAIAVSRPQHGLLPGIVFVNEAFTRLTGYEFEEALGNQVGLLLGPDTEQEALQRVLEGVMRGEEVRERLSLVRKDGEPFVAEMSYLSVGGDSPTFVAIYRDVSEQVAAEEALLRSQQWAQAIVEQGDDLILVTDGDGVFTYASPSVTSVLGYEIDDIVGQSC